MGIKDPRRSRNGLVIPGSGVKSVADNIDGLVKDEAAVGFIVFMLGTRTGFTVVDRHSRIEVDKAGGMSTNHRQGGRCSFTQASRTMKVLPVNVESIMKGGRVVLACVPILIFRRLGVVLVWRPRNITGHDDMREGVPFVVSEGVAVEV